MRRFPTFPGRLPIVIAMSLIVTLAGGCDNEMDPFEVARGGGDRMNRADFTANPDSMTGDPYLDKQLETKMPTYVGEVPDEHKPPTAQDLPAPRTPALTVYQEQTSTTSSANDEAQDEDEVDLNRIYDVGALIDESNRISEEATEQAIQEDLGYNEQGYGADMAGIIDDAMGESDDGMMDEADSNYAKGFNSKNLDELYELNIVDEDEDDVEIMGGSPASDDLTNEDVLIPYTDEDKPASRYDQIHAIINDVYTEDQPAPESDDAGYYDVWGGDATTPEDSTGDVTGDEDYLP